MATTHIGKAALTLVNVGTSIAYVYAGEPVPEGASKEELDRLTGEGFIVATEFPTTIPLDDLGVDVEVVDGPPAKSASKADWEAYARSQGATDADLEGRTKDDLVAAYGD